MGYKTDIAEGGSSELSDVKDFVIENDVLKSIQDSENL